MTSYILLKKLANTQLDKNSMTKLKNEINKISLQRYEAANDLKKILKQDRIRKSCCLCLGSGDHWIFQNNEFDIIKNIKYVLGLEISNETLKPQYICLSCLECLKSATKLKNTAEATQWRLQQEIELISEMEGEEINTDIQYTPSGTGYFKRQPNETLVREWKCKKCSKTFNLEDEFTEHSRNKQCLKKNSISRIYICEVCGMTFKGAGPCNRHRLWHSTELPFSCSLCSYRTHSAAWLRFHWRVHSGERPERCPLCPRSFARPSNLASHRRTHYPPQYQCPTCARPFVNKQAMERHIMSQHSTLKPHVCATCGKTFSIRRLLRNHELKVHKVTKRRGGSIPTYILLQQGDQKDYEQARLTFAAELGHT